MKRSALFWVLGILGVLALGALGMGVYSLNAVAQSTNTDLSGTPSAAPAGGPVVMPPSQSAPVQGTVMPNPAATGKGPPNGDEIYDIRPPFFYLRSWLWLWILLAAVAIVALLYYLLRKVAGRGKLSAKDAYSSALEKLEQARGLMDPANPEPYGVAVSEIIRTYLGQRFGAMSSRRTTEEFLRQMAADPTSPLAGYRELLKDFLQACDLFKFAKYQPGADELEQVHQRAVSFVTATRPVEEQKGAPAMAAAAT